MQKQPYSPLEKRARHISYKQDRPWFICRRRGCSDVVVSDLDVKRYIKIGYEPVCAYYRGALYDTIFVAGGEIRFVKAAESPGLTETSEPGLFLLRFVNAESSRLIPEPCAGIRGSPGSTG